MNILVVGASGGSGRATVQQLLARGHRVTVFTRAQSPVFNESEQLRICHGDVLNPNDVARAVAGQDAVVVTLGITENPLRVRLFGAKHTADDVRSLGTQHVIAAMQRLRVRKLVVLTSYGVGATRGRLGLVERMLFALLLKPQILDTERQDRAVAESDLDWVLVQPVHLTHGDEDDAPFVSTEGATERMQLSRKSLGRFLADAVESARYDRRSLALSGARAATATVNVATSQSRS